MRAVLMSVPEATVDEDYGLVSWQDEVGLAGQRFVFRAVDGETVAEAVEHRAQGEFRFRVASADAGHELGAFLRGEDVGHGKTQDRKTRDARPDRSALRTWIDVLHAGKRW